MGFTEQFKGAWDTHLQRLPNNAYNGKWSQADRDQFAEDAMNTRPILHEDMVPLLKSWLKHKQVEGSPIEKKVYNQMFGERKFDIVDLFNRLLTKRPAALLTAKDSHVLADGRKLKGTLPF